MNYLNLFGLKETKAYCKTAIFCIFLFFLNSPYLLLSKNTYHEYELTHASKFYKHLDKERELHSTNQFLHLNQSFNLFTPGCIEGTAFEDYNCDGDNSAAEPGLAGVEVSVFDCNNSLIGTITTDAQGDWQMCGLTDGDLYRIEFILPPALSSDFTSGLSGSENSSDVQFANTDDVVNFSSCALDACTSSSLLLTSCYNFGGYQGAYAANDAFVGVASNNIDNNTTDAAGDIIHYATHEQIGTTYGLAVNKTTNTAYVAAYMKRHAGFGPGGTGAIYAIDLTQSSPPSIFTDLNTIYGANTAGANPHDYAESDNCTSNNFSCWFNDIDSWDKVGRTSLGDMDISDDETMLYVMNLEDKNVYQVDLANPSMMQTTFPFPLDQATDVNVTLKPRDPAFDMLPFALKYHNGLIYVAALDSELSRHRDNICCTKGGSVVYVYSLDPTTGTWSLVLEEDIQRGGPSGGIIDYFGRWNTSFQDTAGDRFHMIPSDIEFDGDDIILALRDMSADKFGNNAGKPIAGDNETVFHDSKTGDILRFCFDAGTGSYNFEQNGTCGGATSSGANSTYGWPEVGTRGSYYSGDFFSTAHPQTALGGLWNNPSDNRLYATVYDLTETFQAGIKSLDNTTGLARELYILVPDSRPNGGFGKAAGLGDIEGACPILPLEIGNYVWCDSIENGIQDACERGIAGIKVQLYDNTGTLVGLTSTDSNGYYYFNNSNVDNSGINLNGSAASGAYTGPSFSTQYFIVFGDGQFNSGQFSVSGLNYPITSMNDAGSNDNIDSDVDPNNLTSGSLGSRPDGLPFIDLTTQAQGGGEHKYDMGVTCTVYYSLGNQVFLDSDNSGDLNGSESGIDGVQLQLLNADGTIYDSDPLTAGTQGLIVTTGNGGYYRFDNLIAGDYIVEVLATNFGASSVLENFNSSTGANQEADPNTDNDINDNGLDTAVSGAIRSGVVTLETPEPTGEAEPSSYSAGSVTGTAVEDTYANLTVDFGFFSCNLTDAGLADISCNNNGTLGDPTDDYLTFSLNPMGLGVGATYNVTVDNGSIMPSMATYGSATTFQLQNGSAGSGNVTVTIIDAASANCSIDIIINDSGSCARRVDNPDYEDPESPCPDQPCHFVTDNLYLGTGVSGDDTINNNPNADSDDDDGVSILPNMQFVKGNTIYIPVTIYNNSGSQAYLRVWIDWNGDGDFEDAGELIEDDTYASTGGANVIFVTTTIPLDANSIQDIPLRARISTDDTNSSTPCGNGTCAADGEVEDYLLRITCPTKLCMPVTIRQN